MDMAHWDYLRDGFHHSLYQTSGAKTTARANMIDEAVIDAVGHLSR